MILKEVLVLPQMVLLVIANNISKANYQKESVLYVCEIDLGRFVDISILPSGGSHHYAMRENKHAHSISTSVYSNKFTVTTRHFWVKNICEAKANLINQAWHKNQTLAYMHIPSAKSRSARGEHLTNQLSWVSCLTIY